MKREPARSRILVVAGFILAASTCLSVVWADAQPHSWWFLVVLGVWLLLILMMCAGVVITAGPALFGNRAGRPARFEVRPGIFWLRPQVSQGLGTMLQLLLYGFFVGQWVTGWREAVDPSDPVGARVALGMAVGMGALISVWTIILAVLVIWTWLAGPTLELTPAGIRSRSVIASVFIPWEALHTGGPHRPATDALSSGVLRLSFARPELVQYKGLGSSTFRRNPMVGTSFDIHPWLLADAIRWYAEHPEDRAGIGTQEEHDRLVSTVTTDYSRQQAPRPARPAVVTWAVWLATAGAGVGVLLAAANLYIAVAFQDRIAAAELRLPDEESLLPGPTLSAIWLGLVVIAAVVTLLAARGAWRGSQGARIGLIFMSVLVVLSGCFGSCFGSPSMALLDSPGEEPLASIQLGLWTTHQSAAFLLGVAVITLLLVPPADRYFRPRFSA